MNIDSKMFNKYLQTEYRHSIERLSAWQNGFITGNQEWFNMRTKRKPVINLKKMNLKIKIV